MHNRTITTGESDAERDIGTHEFLTFRLGREEYGVDILCVQEIRSFELPTRLANTPDFILGVVNLRGAIVPIIDMRIKFEMASVLYNSSTVAIILNLGKQMVGLVVDAVSDVVALTPKQLRPAPDFSGAIDSNSVSGLASVGDRMLILLDIERTLSNSALMHVLPQESN